MIILRKFKENIFVKFLEIKQKEQLRTEQCWKIVCLFLATVYDAF